MQKAFRLPETSVRILVHPAIGPLLYRCKSITLILENQNTEMTRLIGKNHLEMILPASFQGVTQHHMNFISFDELDTVKELIQQ